MTPITMQCCTCGEEKTVGINAPIRFGFELFGVAKEAGWFPVIDMNYYRTLLFCCEDCMKKQLTKAGTIRKRLVKAQKIQETEVSV